MLPHARRPPPTGVWLAAFVAASRAGPGVVAAFPARPAEPTLGDLVTSDAPQGYQQATPPGLPLGDSTMEEFGRAAGMEIPGLIADVPVSSRAWISGSGVLILMILDGRAGNTAAGFAAGVVRTAPPGSTSFDPGVDGAQGRAFEQDGVHGNLIAWEHAAYGIMVLGQNSDPAAGETAARELAASEAALLVRELGVAPATDAGKSSAAYRMGRLVGYATILCLLGFGIYAIVRRSQRRAAAAAPPHATGPQQWPPRPSGAPGSWIAPAPVGPPAAPGAGSAPLPPPGLSAAAPAPVPPAPPAPGSWPFTAPD